MKLPAIFQGSVLMKSQGILECNKNSSSTAYRAEARPAMPRSTSGFTIIEMLVVVGLVIFIGAIGAVIGYDAIARSTVHSERDLVVLMLTGARTRALANMNENAQGVRITEDEVILFEGEFFDFSNPNNKSIPRNSSITISPTPPVDVVFAQLTANIADVMDIGLSDGSKTALININTNGRIEW